MTGWIFGFPLAAPASGFVAEHTLPQESGYAESVSAEASDKAQTPISTRPQAADQRTGAVAPNNTQRTNGGPATTNVHDSEAHRRLVVLASRAKNQANGVAFGAEWLARLRSRSGMPRPRQGQNLRACGRQGMMLAEWRDAPMMLAPVV